MKKRIIMFALAAIAAISMVSCGKQAEPEVKTLTIDNVDEYIVSLADYKGLSVEADKEVLSDDMLEYYTSYFFSLEAQNITGWAAKAGDTVVMNYVGKIDGVAFNGGTANGAELVLGSNSYIPGFEDGLIGCVAGESRTLNLTFPEDYANVEYAGKTAVFEVTVQYVVPEFGDDAVAALNSTTYTTAGDYRYFVEQALNEYILEDYNNAVVQAALDQIISNSQFNEFPESFLDAQKELVVSQYLDTATGYGIDVATYLGYCGTSLEELTDLFAKQQAVFYSICNKEGLYPSEQDIADNAALFAEYYNYESVEAFYADNSRDDFINTLIGSNVFEYLLGVTTVNAGE